MAVDLEEYVDPRKYTKGMCYALCEFLDALTQYNQDAIDDISSAIGYDGELFDYDWGIDDEYYLVGTIHDKDGQAYMDTDDSFYDVWYATDMLNARQVLAMTEDEINEQVERLQ